MSPVRMRALLVLTVVGFVVPNTMFIVFLAQHSFDLGRYFSDWFETLPSTQLFVDLLLGLVAFITWVRPDGERSNVRRWWAAIPAALLVGMCFAIPLYLLLRERALERAAA